MIPGLRVYNKSLWQKQPALYDLNDATESYLQAILQRLFIDRQQWVWWQVQFIKTGRAGKAVGLSRLALRRLRMPEELKQPLHPSRFSTR
ncbi:hypothetical protein ACMA1I_20130 [Pontibacter sp. 13R65]|uniref:hypothetical protein n=1 Tax=Pontibacter sp. 13R65 TaxID=3127458 RepID=UPI00301BC496